MSIVKMNKISIIGLESEKDIVMENLMKMGVVEVIDLIAAKQDDELSQLVKRDGDLSEIAKLEMDIANVKSAVDYLEKYNTAKKSLFETKRTISDNQYLEVVDNKEKVWSIVHKIGKYDEQLVALRSEENKLNNLILNLNPWISLDVPLETNGTSKTVVEFGVLPSIVDTDKLKKELLEKVEYCYINILASDKDQSYVFIVYHRDCHEEIVKDLKQNGFSKAAFKDMEGTPLQNINNANKRISEIKNERSIVEKYISQLSHEKKNIEVLYDHLIMLRDRKKVLNNVIKTDKVFMLEGWIPEELGSQVKEFLSNHYLCNVDIIKPKADEEFPILLSNGNIAESVESITKMYSLPNYKEIDPNKIMAPFFILFFGLMLSDGGYGLVMMLLAGIVLWKFELEDSIRKFMKLMFYCGVSTVFWGALFGGWFGIEALSNYPLWFNPVKDPEEMLRWSLLFGVIHIYIGIGVRAANLIRQRRYLDVIFDVLVWYVFFTGFVLFTLPYTPKVNAESVTGLVEIGKYLLIIGAILLILTQGRNQKSLVMKLVSGLGKLYDLIGFMSDVLSYSRLLALGLATSVIASIVNDMGAMGIDPTVSLLSIKNIIGIILFIAVLLFGHAFNFAINALGAYVHSSRLQYIEFFGKFYEGGGTAFNPLKANTKYINLKN